MYGYESSATLTTDRLHCKLQTRPLVRHGAPRRRAKQLSSKRKEKEKFSHGPQRGARHQDGYADWLSVTTWTQLTVAKSCVNESSMSSNQSKPYTVNRIMWLYIQGDSRSFTPAYGTYSWGYFLQNFRIDLWSIFNRYGVITDFRNATLWMQRYAHTPGQLCVRQLSVDKSWNVACG
jgi:hypothetical protein